MSFRTAKEAISLANNTLYGLGASVWSQQIGLAMEVACNIKAGSVWINNHNLFDAATGLVVLKKVVMVEMVGKRWDDCSTDFEVLEEKTCLWF